MRNTNWIAWAMPAVILALVVLLMWQGSSYKGRLTRAEDRAAALQTRNAALQHALDAKERIAGITQRVGAVHASLVGKILAEDHEQVARIEAALSKEQAWALVAVPQSVIDSLEESK